MLSRILIHCKFIKITQVKFYYLIQQKPPKLEIYARFIQRLTKIHKKQSKDNEKYLRTSY